MVVLEAGEAEASHLFLLEICVVLIGLFREMLFWEICERPGPKKAVMCTVQNFCENSREIRTESTKMGFILGRAENHLLTTLYENSAVLTMGPLCDTSCYL